MKFTEKYVICREACFNKKDFYKWAKHETESKKQSTEWKHMKKKFWVQQSVKKVMQTDLWNMKGPITIDFQERSATINSASNSQCFKQNSPQTNLVRFLM